MGRVSASYYVCMVKDSDGAVSFEAIRSTKLKDRQKELLRDYAEAYKAWRMASKEAQKAGEEFDEPKPKKPGLRKISSKKIKGEDKARSLASLYQEKWDAKMQKKEAKALKEFEDDEPAKDEKDTKKG